ncbi:hypothetical protein WA158_008232 [Blastocystis sp. Blastoise]
MSTTEFRLTEDKYLFTFQDDAQICIPKDFIEKYQEFPFHDIIKNFEKYDDGTYYIDMLPFHIERVISFLMADNMDIFSLNLKDSYDIYQTLIEYSVKIDKEIQSDLLYHVKGLFYKYLKDNNYDVYVYINCIIKECMPIELFNLEKKEICFNGLLTPKRKDELLYYSLLFKMMNITRVEIIYAYSSNIPIEYICPSCIKDIFHSLEKLEINVTTHYNKTELLLNPNSDEYIMEYNRLFNEYDYEIINPEEYEYYAESEMNEYNKISSSLDRNKLYYSRDLIDTVAERRDKNELPKLYKHIVNEAIYTNDYSQIDINKTENEYTLDDEVRIEYDEKTNDKTFIIDKVYTKHCISQLLLLPSYLYLYHQIDPMFFMKLFEEGVIDSLTTLNIELIKKLANKIDENLFNKIMATHVFPNVTELIYDDDEDDDEDEDDDDNDNDDDEDEDKDKKDNDDDEDDDNNDDESFQLSSIKKECFPKLHIITYDIIITTKNFDSLFSINLMSMIDTIRIHNIDYDKEEEIALRLDEIVYTHSIHININDYFICYFPHLNKLLAKKLISIDYLSIRSSRSENINLFESIENNNQSIDSLDLAFIDDDNDDDDDDDDDDNDDDDDDEDDDEDEDKDKEDNDHDHDQNKIDVRNSLERFLNSDILKHLNNLDVLFDENISIEYLTWISTLFNDNKFNNILKLEIDLSSMEENSSSEALTAYENILEKLISKASIITIKECTMTFINRLIPKGCFHKTTQLILDINDIPDDNFCKLYTKDNFPQLKSINIYQYHNIEWWSPFIDIFCRYMTNSNFLSSSIVRLRIYKDNSDDDYIYDPNNSILRCKYDSNSFINTIIGTKDEEMNKYEIETIFDCINQNKTQNIRSLALYIYDKEQLSKLTKYYDISDEKITVYKQQLNDSSFIQKNHVDYTFGIFH